jgi:hypothetical protein
MIIIHLEPKHSVPPTRRRYTYPLPCDLSSPSIITDAASQHRSAPHSARNEGLPNDMKRNRAGAPEGLGSESGSSCHCTVKRPEVASCRCGLDTASEPGGAPAKSASGRRGAGCSAVHEGVRQRGSCVGRGRRSAGRVVSVGEMLRLAGFVLLTCLLCSLVGFWLVCLLLRFISQAQCIIQQHCKKTMIRKASPAALPPK